MTFRHLFLLLGWLLIGGWLQPALGQARPEWPTLTVGKVVKLDNEERPLAPCVRYILRDEKGRLWMETCGVWEQLFSQRLLRYDGYNFSRIDVTEAEMPGRTHGRLIGHDGELGLYGFVNHPYKGGMVFAYRAETDSSRFSPLLRGRIAGMTRRVEGWCWILLVRDDRQIICRWNGSRLEQVDSLAIPEMGIVFDQQLRNENLSLHYYQHRLWIIGLYPPLLSYEPASRRWTLIDQTSFPAMADHLPLNSTKLALSAVQHDRLYVYMPRFSPSVFTFDPRRQRFDPLPGIPAAWRCSGLYTDETGHLLLTFEDDQGRRHALLRDSTGRQWDYGAIIRTVEEIETISSRNFPRDAYIACRHGAYYVSCRHTAGIETLFPGLSVRGIVETTDGHTLLGTADRKLFWTRDGQTGNMNERASPCYGALLPEMSNEAVIASADGRPWVKTKRSIARLGRPGEACERHDFSLVLHKAAFIDQQTLLLIAGDDRGLYRYELPTRRLRPVLIGGQPVRLISSVHELYCSPSGVIWVTTSNGLYRIDPRADEREVIGFGDDFEDFRFLTIHEDESGRLWLGTVNSGLHIYDPRQRKVVKVLNSRQGLCNNTVVSILADEQGDRWIGTFEGLALVSPQGELLANFNTDDGLCHNEFNRFSYYRARDGKLWMGTVDGVNVIDPAVLKNSIPRRPRPSIYLSQLQYYDSRREREISYQTPDPAAIGEVVLPADRRQLRLQVGLSNYGYTKSARFAYRLEGISKDWSYLGAHPWLTLGDLPAGRYQLLIKGIDHGGQWTDPLAIPIRAREFFYKQAWFYLVCLLPFLAFAMAWIHRLRREKTRLAAEVRRRTRRIEQDKDLIVQQARELRALDELKTRFFTNISHELRTPVTLISTPVTHILDKYADRLRGEPEKALRIVGNNARKLQSLVEELLELSRIDAGQSEPVAMPTPLYTFCRQLFSAFESAAQLKGIDYRFTYEAPKDLLPLLDRNRVAKIVNNLLSNALKFTPAGGKVQFAVGSGRSVGSGQPAVGSEQPATGNSQPATANRLLLTVTDTGRGIPPEDLPQVFDRYFQTKNKSIPTEGGTGIGLALSKELAALLQGELSVESSWGQGSVFTLTLPLVIAEGLSDREWPLPPMADPPAEIELPIQPAALATPLPDDGRPTILIVEDNADMQQLIGTLLADSYHSVVANHGEEAWTWLAAEDAAVENISLILSDVMMPRMDGYTLLENIKAHPRWRRLPVIMLTARAAEEDRLRALRLGVDDYLAKPFSPAELLARVDNLINNYRQREAYQSKMGVAFSFEPTPSADQTWLQELEAIALAALDKKLDLSASYLADQMALSERQLLRRLRVLIGLSTKQYIQEVKLQKARHLLEQKAYHTIAEVAYACGFQTPNYFAKVFQQHFGQLPSGYSEVT